MILDIIVLIILFASALIAFLRGFIRETLTIVGVVGGLAAAYFWAPLLNPAMSGWLGIKEGEEPKLLFDVLPYPILASLLSYGLIFITVVIVLSILSHVMAESVRSLGLGAVDRTLGVVFGLARGIIGIGLLYLPFYFILSKDDKAEWFAGSRTHFYVEKTAEIMASYIPEETIDSVEKGAKEKIEQAKSTRDTVKQIDLLKQGGARPENDKPLPADGTETAPAEEETTAPQNGYNNEFRNNMDRLFEDKTQNGSAEGNQ